MEHLEIDWLEHARRAAIWRTLPLETRHVLLRHKPADKFDMTELGAAHGQLLAEQFVTVTGSRHVSVHPTQRPHARALRAMHRHDLLAQPAHTALAAYVYDHYAHAERVRLASESTSRYYGHDAWVLVRQASTAAWLRSALDAADGATEAAPRHAGRIVRAVLERGGVLPVEELPDLLAGSVPPARFNAAVLTGLARLWLLATMRGEDLIPVFALWPAAVERVLRPPAKTPQPCNPAHEVSLPLLLHDVTALLIAAASEPLRLRGSDQALFAKAAERVSASLVPVPRLLGDVATWDAPTRVDRALDFSRALSFTRGVGQPGRDLRLEVTPGGGAWLAAPAADRLRRLIDGVRLAERTETARITGATRPDAHSERPSIVTGLDTYDPGEVLDGDDDVDDYRLYGVDHVYPFDDFVSYRSREALSLLGTHVYPDALREQLEAAIIAAFGALPTDAFVPLREFTAFHAEHHNPLAIATTSHMYWLRGGGRAPNTTEDPHEQSWSNTLTFVVNRLFPFGGVILGDVEGSGVAFRLTPAGRYLLGLATSLDAEDMRDLAGAHAAGAPQIVVQPNFDVVFLATAPAAEAEIGRFAQRTGHRVGTLFKITRESVFAAAAAGISADDVLDVLARTSTQSVPSNVATEVAGWFAVCRRITAAPALLLRCPDEETATRALAAAGRDAQRLAPTILELTGPRHPTALARKLHKHGIFIDQFGDGPKRGSRQKQRM